jgi:hypothetical protein
MDLEPVVSLEGLSFSGLVWTFKLLPPQHIETSMALWVIHHYMMKEVQVSEWLL